jgi:hypothetical protein
MKLKPLFALALAATTISCQTTKAPTACDACDACEVPATKPAALDLPTTGVRAITLPVIETELPPGPGKLTLVSACTLCHSQRYVTMQPSFSKKKWTEEVDKMKKVYGAPIQDEQVEPIVNYLVAIRGNGQ